MGFRLGRLGKEMAREAAEYTSSLRIDSEIYRQVILINAVHLRMLNRLGLIGDEDLSKALRALKAVYDRPLSLDDPALEDVHMVVENFLSQAAPGAGGNLALGKSRNDAVATAIRMRAKELVVLTVREALPLVDAVLEKAEAEAETIYPATTHLQVAAPSTFGFILTHYASRLLSALEWMVKAYEELDLSPLGAAACCGSSIRLDREWIAEQLGFRGVVEHALEASSSRDFTVTLASAALRLLIVVSDMAEDLIYAFTAGLVDIGDEYCSTSSIMPQKKNPVVLEVARTKSAEALGELAGLVAILQRRVGGYVLDLQQATPSVWKTLHETRTTLRVLAGLINTLAVNREQALKVCGPEAGIVELADYLSVRYGVPFRLAHKVCGEISRALAEGTLSEENLRSILQRSGLAAVISLQDLTSLTSPTTVVRSYTTRGSSNPEEVRRMSSALRLRIGVLGKWVEGEERRLSLVAERVLEAGASSAQS
jgi:argininosuccinate lyase